MVATVLAILGSSASVAADTPGGHGGVYGVHYLADSEEYPGVTCKYDGDNVLKAVRTRDPFVFASDHPDGQLVGWRMLVQEDDGSPGGFDTVARSAVQFGRALDDRPAKLSPLRVTLDGQPGAIYRVKVKMLWFVTPTGKVLEIEGRATHRVDWYRYILAGPNPGFCPGAIL